MPSRSSAARWDGSSWPAGSATAPSSSTSAYKVLEARALDADDLAGVPRRLPRCHRLRGDPPEPGRHVPVLRQPAAHRAVEAALVVDALQRRRRLPRRVHRLPAPRSSYGAGGGWRCSPSRRPRWAPSTASSRCPSWIVVNGDYGWWVTQLAGLATIGLGPGPRRADHADRARPRSVRRESGGAYPRLRAEQRQPEPALAGSSIGWPGRCSAGHCGSTDLLVGGWAVVHIAGGRGSGRASSSAGPPGPGDRPGSPKSTSSRARVASSHERGPAGCDLGVGGSPVGRVGLARRRGPAARACRRPG